MTDSVLIGSMSIPVFKTVADRDRAMPRPLVGEVCMLGGRLMQATPLGTWATLRGERTA